MFDQYKLVPFFSAVPKIEIGVLCPTLIIFNHIIKIPESAQKLNFVSLRMKVLIDELINSHTRAFQAQHCDLKAVTITYIILAITKTLVKTTLETRYIHRKPFLLTL